MDTISKKNKKIKEICLYVIFGTLTTTVSIVTFYIFIEKLNINYVLSNIISSFFAVIFAYITNKVWVFNNKSFKLKDLAKEVLSFIGSRLVSLIIEVIVMFVLIDIINIAIMLSKILVSIVVIILNYVFSKLFVFKNN